MNSKVGPHPTEEPTRNFTQPILGNQVDKRLSRERILRRIDEVIECSRPNLTVESWFHEPARPKRRRKSPILRKCEDLMEALWEDGYRREILWHTLREYVMTMCGGFRTTLTDYLGRRAKFYRSRGRKGVLKTPSKQGYLEKFGFIEKKSPKILKLHHERVNRSYHYAQRDIVSFSLPNSRDCIDGTKCVTNTTTLLLHTQREREIKNLKQRCHKPPLTQEELRILKGASRETH